MLEEKYLRLQQINQELSDNLDLMTKENQYYLEYVNKLRAEIDKDKTVSSDNSNDKERQNSFVSCSNTQCDSQREPRYTNMGRESLRIDKFPGKIGYIPRKKYDK